MLDLMLNLKFVFALILAAILAVFGFDDIFVTALNELFGLSGLTSASYYFIFFAAGLILDIISFFTKRNKNKNKNNKEEDTIDI